MSMKTDIKTILQTHRNQRTEDKEVETSFHPTMVLGLAACRLEIQTLQ